MIKIIFEEKKKKPSLDPSLDSEETTMTEEKLPINDIKYGGKYIHSVLHFGYMWAIYFNTSW